MKLADNVKEFLMLYQDKSPLEVRENSENIIGDFASRAMKDFFVYEDGDLEKYPDSFKFLERHFTSSDLIRTFNDFKQPYGFFRKKNSAKEILAQKDIEERFPFKAIMKVFCLRNDLNDWIYAEKKVKETVNRLKDIPKEEFLNELNKEEN